MIHPYIRSLKNNAKNKTAKAPNLQKIVLYYALILLGAALANSLLQNILDSQISGTGGLHNIGLRSVFSSMGSFLGVVQALVNLCINFGFMAAMVRISREQYTTPMTLKAGVDRFWALIRLSTLKMVIYLGLLFFCVYIAASLFMLSPWSAGATAVLGNAVADSTLVGPETVVMDDALVEALLPTMLPMICIYGVLILLFFVPMSYRFRMTDYILYDRPDQGALFAIRESRRMMWHNRFFLFKLDLSFWWYYVLLFLAQFVIYTDLILQIFGIELPLSGDTIFYLALVVTLGLQFLLITRFRGYMDTTYALAYNALYPPLKKEDDAVVLGNIFNM